MTYQVRCTTKTNGNLTQSHPCFKSERPTHQEGRKHAGELAREHALDCDVEAPRETAFGLFEFFTSTGYISYSVEEVNVSVHAASGK